MKLWEVTNGFTGFSYVRVLVIAENKARAIKLAHLRYAAENKAVHRQTERWLKKLEATCLCEDTSQEWSTEPSDG